MTTRGQLRSAVGRVEDNLRANAGVLNTTETVTTRDVRAYVSVPGKRLPRRRPVGSVTTTLSTEGSTAISIFGLGEFFRKPVTGDATVTSAIYTDKGELGTPVFTGKPVAVIREGKVLRGRKPRTKDGKAIKGIDGPEDTLSRQETQAAEAVRSRVGLGLRARR